MPGIQELLGLSPQGLGGNVSGMNALREQELREQQGLAQLMQTQRANRAADIQAERDLLTLGAERQLQPSKVAAGIAGNEEKIGEAALAKQQQFGQLLTQFGPALGNVPAEQRSQILQQMATKIPGITEDPTFQRLLQTDPNQLPLAIKSVGTDILLNTGEQMRAMALQKQRDDAAMARTRVSEAGANARQQAGFANAENLEKLRIAAGKYNKKDVMADPAAAVLKYGPEKLAALALYEMNNATDPIEKEAWRKMGSEAASLGGFFRSSGATPRTTVDPTVPGGLGTVDPYGQRGNDPFAQQFNQPQQQRPVPQGLPQGTVNNGDGTFTLPDGRRIRAKK